MLLPVGFLTIPGGMEWLVVLVVALLLFGKRLPEVMRSLGASVTEFKKGMNEATSEIQNGLDDEDKDKPKDQS